MALKNMAYNILYKDKVYYYGDYTKSVKDKNQTCDIVFYDEYNFGDSYINKNGNISEVAINKFIMDYKNDI